MESAPTSRIISSRMIVAVPVLPTRSVLFESIHTRTVSAWLDRNRLGTRVTAFVAKTSVVALLMTCLTLRTILDRTLGFVVGSMTWNIACRCLVFRLNEFLWQELGIVTSVLLVACTTSGRTTTVSATVLVSSEHF